MVTSVLNSRQPLVITNKHPDDNTHSNVTSAVVKIDKVTPGNLSSASLISQNGVNSIRLGADNKLLVDDIATNKNYVATIDGIWST